MKKSVITLLAALTLFSAGHAMAESNSGPSHKASVCMVATGYSNTLWTFCDGVLMPGLSYSENNQITNRSKDISHVLSELVNNGYDIKAQSQAGEGIIITLVKK